VEDWRIEVDLPDEQHQAALLEHLLGGDPDLAHAVVTRDGSTVFVYPHDEAQARAAEGAIRRIAADKGLRAEIALTRWHEAEEAWEPASKPLPQTPAESEAEHEQLIERERDQTATQHRYAFDVLATLEHHGQAHELAERLQREGLAVSRRWRYVVVGAADEDEAAQLEKRIGSEAPSGTTVTTFTADNLRDSVNYVDELAADSAFTVPGLPGTAR
jgi:hypothetical protein